MQLIEVQLLTDDLTAQRHFYAGALGLPVLEASEERLALRAGRSRLTFRPEPAGRSACCHFAFTIPENQFPQAKAWLSARASLVRDSAGRDEFNFEAWNAHAMYCYDPAGNIVELIARHDLANVSDAPFGGGSLLAVSELGLVTDDVDATVELIRSWPGAEVYRGSRSDEFAALGDAHGLLIAVKEGRIWFPDTGQAARACPVSALLTGPDGQTYCLSGPPYAVMLEAGE